MRLTTTLAAAGIALGITVAGAAAATAVQSPDGWSPAQWAHQTSSSVTETVRGVGAGYDADDTTGAGYGMREGATGDPATCPYADDATADRDQDRDRLRDHDGDGTSDGDRLQMHERMHTTS